MTTNLTSNENEKYAGLQETSGNPRVRGEKRSRVENFEAYSRVIRMLRRRVISSSIVRSLDEQLEIMNMAGMSLQPVFRNARAEELLRKRPGDRDELPMSWEILPGSPVCKILSEELQQRRCREYVLAKMVDRNLNLLNEEERNLLKRLYMTPPSEDRTTLENLAEELNGSVSSLTYTAKKALKKLDSLLFGAE